MPKPTLSWRYYALFYLEAVLAQRYDSFSIGKFDSQKIEFPVFPVALAKAGVYSYLRNDGTVQREFVPPEELSNVALSL